MGMIQRAYYTLEEAVAHWGLSETELRYVVENGLLTLSLRIYGSVDQSDGRPGAAKRRRDFEGVVDLHRRDAIELLAQQERALRAFRLPEGGEVTLADGEPAWTARRQALIVRAEEQDRFDAALDSEARPRPDEYHRFLCFRFLERDYRFTEMQARALHHLFLISALAISSPPRAPHRSSSATSSRAGRVGARLSCPCPAGGAITRWRPVSSSA
jgi:hypothetical protein